MKTKVVVVALLALGMLTGILMAAPPAAGALTFALDPPKYSGAYYVPGEQMQFTIGVTAPADPRVWDVLVVWDDGVTYRNWSGNQFDNVDLGTVNPITLNFNIDPTMKDGDWYYVRVYDSTWIETNGTVGNMQWSQRFSIRTWLLNVELSRRAYLPGDVVTVIWSANMIRDGSLAPGNGYGLLWVYEIGPGFNQPVAGVTWPQSLTGPTGTYAFQLLGSVPVNHQVNAFAYYNNTQANPDRFSFDQAIVPINGLRMMVNVASLTYQPGAIVPVDISAKVTDAAPNAGDPGAAGVEVDITVTDQTTGRTEASYGAQNLLTDDHGNIRYVFQLNATIPDGESFLVRADGVANNAVTNFATDTFIVRTSAGLTLVLTFNKNQYLSGDTVTMTADVSGSAGPFTFVYEARDGGAGGNLLDRQTTTAKTYSYRIPDRFDGQITFLATADDGNGNRASGNRAFNVLLGILVVNLDKNEYGAGETVTATGRLTSNVLSGPDYFYEVFDSSVVPNVLVKSGRITVDSTGAPNPVTYTVPAVPSTSYLFRITASKDGRALSGSATTYLVSGVVLSVSFDKSSYMPGETVRIGYSLTARGPRTALPSSFTLQVSMPGAPSKTVQTTSASGEITYTIPNPANNGDVLIFVAELNTGAQAYNVIHVGGVNPFMADVGGVPAISVILLLLVVIILIVMFVMWRRMMPGAPMKAPGAEKPAPPPPPPTAGPGPAPMTVACKACGASIEITTSKRPIEVMCPSCGETQMVQ